MNSIFSDFSILDQIFRAPGRPEGQLPVCQADKRSALTESFDSILPPMEGLTPGFMGSGALIQSNRYSI